MASTTARTSHIISNMNFGASGDGVDVTMYGDTSGSYIQWDASDNRLEGTGGGQILIGESTTGVTTAGGTTMIYGYASHGTNALTGEVIGVRGNARVNVASASGAAIGGYFQAGNMSAGVNLSTARGVYAEVVNKVPTASSATWTNARGVEINMDLDQGSSGHTNTVTNAYMLYGVYNLPTAGSYATVTNGYGVYLVNEAVGGTGQQLDAAYYAKGLNQSGGIIAWDYGLQLYNTKHAIYTESTLSGSSAVNAVDFEVTDNTTASSGYSRGLYVNYTGAGAKTGGSTEGEAIGIDATWSGNTPMAYGIMLYTITSGNPTLSWYNPIGIYCDNMGSACSAAIGIDIGMAGANSPTGSGRHAYIRCRAHNSANRPEAVLLLEGAGSADYIFQVTHPDYAPFDSGTGATSACVGHIAVRFVDTATTRYLRLYADTT